VHGKTLITKAVGFSAALLAVAAFSAAPALADNSAPAPDPSSCSAQVPNQVFMGNGDFNYYVPAPDASTWTLSGGAHLVTTQLADGTQGTVLDLPAGSQAVSPYICVNSSYSTARMMVDSLKGGDNVQFAAAYSSSHDWPNPHGTGGANGQGTAWTLSNPINLNVPNLPGGPANANSWQIMQITLTPGGGHSEFQVYGLNFLNPAPAIDTSACTAAALSPLFSAFNDQNLYSLAPGQTWDNFNGAGWSLSGGAKIVTTQLQDGSTGQVLDLPAGAQAVSPNTCVTSAYPTSRMMVQSLNGGDQISFRVSYGNTNTWTNPHETGHAQGNGTAWTLTDPLNLQPANGAGWQTLRLTLVAQGGHSEFYAYNLGLDPYSK
jgi:hypothetical protein